MQTTVPPQQARPAPGAPPGAAGPSPAPSPPPASIATPTSRPLTDAEKRAQKRQLELLAEDCKRICSGDTAKPFLNLQDAVDRLLPFHILGSLGESEADLEDTPDHAGQDLLCSRTQAWADSMQRHAIQVAHTIESLQQRVAAARSRRAGPGPGSSSALDDSVVISRLLTNDTKARLARERARPPGPAGADWDEVGEVEEVDTGPGWLELQRQQQQKQKGLKPGTVKAEAAAGAGAAGAAPAGLQAKQQQQPQQQEVKHEAAEEEEAMQEQEEQQPADGLGAFGGLGDLGAFNDEGLEEYVEDED